MKNDRISARTYLYEVGSTSRVLYLVRTVVFFRVNKPAAKGIRGIERKHFHAVHSLCRVLSCKCGVVSHWHSKFRLCFFLVCEIRRYNVQRRQTSDNLHKIRIWYDDDFVAVETFTYSVTERNFART